MFHRAIVIVVWRSTRNKRHTEQLSEMSLTNDGIEWKRRPIDGERRINQKVTTTIASRAENSDCKAWISLICTISFPLTIRLHGVEWADLANNSPQLGIRKEVYLSQTRAIPAIHVELVGEGAGC